LLVHAAALACAWFALPPAAFAFAGAGLALSSIHHWRLPALPRGIEWRPDSLHLHDTAGLISKARFVDGAAPNAYWGVLHYSDAAGRSRHGLFAADCAEPQAFRRLRMWLRWHPRDAACAAK
jgi:hypothetical protein